MMNAWRIFMKYKFFILTVTIICLLASLLTSLYGISPAYESTSVLIVTGSQEQADTADYMTILANKQMVKTYNEIILSSSILKQVARELNFSVTVPELRNAIRTRQLGDTELMEIRVLYHSPKKAADIANSTASVFIRYVENELKLGALKLVDPAVENGMPVQPSTLMITVVSTLVGFSLAFAGCLLVNFLRQPVALLKH